MKRIALSTLAVAAVLASAGLAVAHERGDGMRGDRAERPMFGQAFDFAAVDTDGDGKITQAEIEANAKARFDAADTDGNGSLSAEELAAHAEAQRAERAADRRAKMIERMDGNGDGALSFDEMQAARSQTPMDRMFDRLDADEDGALSQEELDSARERFAERMERGEGGKRHGEGEHRMFRDR